MRKFRLLTLLLLASTFIFVNCTKEGPEGPAGATGPQGPAGNTGATGAAGSANVIYSAWHTLPNSWRDSSVTGSNMKVNHETVVSVTSQILANGVVLGYFRIPAAGSQPLPLPYTNVVGTWGFIPDAGKIFYTLFVAGNPAPPLPTPSATNEYRWIVIPGGVLGGRSGNTEKVAEIEGQLYTETQLKEMSYNEICGLLKIAQ